MSKILGAHIPSVPKNLIINGALDFWQEKNGTTTTINTASSAVNYAADMVAVASFGSTNKNYSFVRSTDVPSQAQSGFVAPYSLLFTTLTAIPSPAATDQVNPWLYFMEGVDYVKIHSKKVTFGFWINASVPGTYSFALRNNNGDRSYVTTFTVSGSNTWEFKSITVQLDNAGTWAFDINRGLTINIGSIAGANQSTSLLNTWQAGNFIASTTNTNFIATVNSTLKISMFSVVEGTLGLGPTGFARQGNSLSEELLMCQRYLYVDSSPKIWADGYGAAGVGYVITAPFFYKATMRTIPGLTLPTFNTTNLNAAPSLFINDTFGFELQAVNQNIGRFIFQYASGTLIADARL